MSAKDQVFSVSRNDYLFEHNASNDMFRFSALASSIPLDNDGIVHSEELGFDFQNDCTPHISINPPTPEFLREIDIDAEELQIVVMLEDHALHTRREDLKIPLLEVKEKTSHKINLKKHLDLSFYTGFTVTCFISRKKNVAEQDHLIWNKSHTIAEKNFTVKAAIDGSIFEIVWVKFSDDDKKNLLYYIDWISSEVSSMVDTDCFQVNANSELKDQFLRLQKHKIGALTTRLMANSILTELLEKTLCFADLSKTPQVDSLHQKFSDLLESNNYSFEDLAKDIQGKGIEQMSATTEITKFIQKLNGTGKELGNIGFGGYR